MRVVLPSLSLDFATLRKHSQVPEKQLFPIRNPLLYPAELRALLIRNVTITSLLISIIFGLVTPKKQPGKNAGTEDATPNTERISASSKVAECLYRNHLGRYFALVKVHGKQIKRSLKTADGLAKTG